MAQYFTIITTAIGTTANDRATLQSSCPVVCCRRKPATSPTQATQYPGISNRSENAKTQRKHPHTSDRNIAPAAASVTTPTSALHYPCCGSGRIGPTIIGPVTPPAPMSRQPPGQTLLFDADDTLWENNIYFERAISAFISYLDHRVHTPEKVRDHLNRVEHATIKAQGYGIKSFRKSLIACFEQLTDQPITPEKHARIVSFAQSIADQEIELLPGVAPTIAELATRHRCILVTKGDDLEQRDKLARSGLAAQFAAVEVLHEKNAAAYRSLILDHVCDAPVTWMIGNSPRSDVNPALAAGLHAVFIPHDFTWVLEHEVVNQPAPGQHLLELATFADLIGHF
jgi:putative hydrolase of the HAD superfamily